MNPCLYLVKQMAHGNEAHGCGASGTHMYIDSDPPYGSENASLTGLLSRQTMYVNYWLPIMKGTIYAAMRVKKALVTELGQRIGEDHAGNRYNINRGNQTLVLTREKEFQCCGRLERSQVEAR